MNKINRTCDVFIVNEEKVEKAKTYLGNIKMEDQVRYYKIFSDENRLKIVYSLISQEELCVCDISEVIGASSATTSHHLQNLKKEKILDSRRDGKLSYYFIIDHTVTDLLHYNFER